MSSSNDNKRAASEAFECQISSVGLATKTKKGKSSAWERFKEFQNERQEDIFLEIKDCNDDVKCNVIKERLIGFAHWLVEHPLEKRNICLWRGLVGTWEKEVQIPESRWDS